MKKYFFVLFPILSLPLFAISQSSDIPSPDVKKLVLNSSPAYFLLGVQPENIQRPSTPRELVGGVQSSLVNGTLQPNFAMEFNPFTWNKKTKSNQFYSNDFFYKKKEAVKKNFAISLATSSSDTVVFGNLKKGMGIGYGLRLTLLPGKVNKETTDLFSEWEIQQVKTLWLTILKTHTPERQFLSINDVTTSEDDLKKIEASLRKNGAIRPESITNLMLELKTYTKTFSTIKASELKQTVEDKLKQTSDEKIQTINKINAAAIPFERDGFILEVAAAGVTVLQNNEWKQSHHGKTAIWITPSYKFRLENKTDPKDVKSIDFMGVIRYVLNDKAVDTGDYLDLGLKFQYNKNRWNFSFEYCGRHASEVPQNVKSKWTNSWISSFNYTINETATLKFSFGSNFDGNTRTYTQPNKMLAIGGINLGIF
jgi:hypothetical protein